MNKTTLLIGICVLFLFVPASAFEDTFQYYPGGDFSSVWIEDGDAISTPTYSGYSVTINTGTGATYSRSMRLYVYDATPRWTSDWAWCSVFNNEPSASTYWAFNTRKISATSASENDIFIYLRIESS